MDNNFINVYIETMKESLVEAMTANIMLNTKLKIASKEIEELNTKLKSYEDMKAVEKSAKKTAE
jgi:uncharacterized coiled-coil DUF342 family protein